MANQQEVRRADDWELRCRFNRGSYAEKLQAGALIEKRKRIGTPDPSVGLPEGSISEDIYYLDSKTKEELVRFHQYTLPDGSIGASGRRDPKRIKIGSVWYRRKQGEDESLRDPCLLFSKLGCHRLHYANFRRFCCRIGPEFDRMVAKITTPVLRFLFRVRIVGRT
jgi:hypothetical protein